MIEISRKAATIIKDCKIRIDLMILNKEISEKELVSIMENLNEVISEFPVNAEVCALCKSKG